MQVFTIYRHTYFISLFALPIQKVNFLKVFWDENLCVAPVFKVLLECSWIKISYLLKYKVCIYYAWSFILFSQLSIDVLRNRPFYLIFQNSVERDFVCCSKYLMCLIYLRKSSSYYHMRILNSSSLIEIRHISKKDYSVKSNSIYNIADRIYF